MSRKVEVVPHDPQWREEFEHESKQIALAVGDNLVAVHHIGSTSIPELDAKPIIDILVEVNDITKVDENSSGMETIGYEGMGEYGIPGRRYFRKDNQLGIRTHHVHMFEVNSPQVERHLAFRDYMISHPKDAHKYGELKRELAKKYPDNIEAYMEGKDGFIKEMDRKAAEWRRGSIGNRQASNRQQATGNRQKKRESFD